MIRHIVVISLSILITTFYADSARANPCLNTPDVLIVLDRSDSMSGYNKWAMAKQAVSNVGANFSSKLALGLMIFPRWPSVHKCTEGQVNVQPALNNENAINTTISSTYPQGNTPMGATLAAAKIFFDGYNSGNQEYVILITDGMETCGGNPIASATNLFASGVKTFVIGFGTGVDPTTLNATASAGGTGSYHQANNLTQLDAALNTIIASIPCCGDGVIQSPSEKCDTAIPGSCPTNCDDLNSCTKDTMAGSACTASCTNTPITQAISGDGCCPPGATFATDNDCSNPCGNGIVDSGETCDLGIPQNHPGACPTNCNDNDSCTLDTITGSDCTLECTHSNICVCGNGILDSNEKCDTAISQGNLGACPSNCDDNDPCTLDSLNGSDCSQECVYTQIGADLNTSDGCCPPGKSANEDIDCLPLCQPDTTEDCVNPCEGVECPDGQYCKGGTCVPYNNDTPPSGNEGEAGLGSVSGGCACEVNGSPDGAFGFLLMLLVVCLVRRKNV